MINELDASIAYAKAWNCLNLDDFTDLLAPDVRYSSQWVFEELEGKETISDHLAGKMHTIKESPGTTVFAELGKATKGHPGKDCVALAQGNKNEVTAVVLFTVEGGRIRRIDMCMPELLDVIRSGNYPE